MPTPDEIAVIRAKTVSERTPEEKALLQEVDHPSAETKKTDISIPKARLDEVIKERDEARQRAAEIEQAAKDAEKKRLEAEQNYKALYEQAQAELSTAKPKAAMVEAMESTLSKLLESQILEMPEDRRGLVPDGLSTQGKLDWIAKNHSILMAPKAFDIGAGRQGGTQGTAQQIELTPEEKIWAEKLNMTYEEYYKNR